MTGTTPPKPAHRQMDQPPLTVFYSWQSELPNSTNRGFIGDALEKAIKELTKDGHVIKADRDTLGLPGSPKIVDSIFQKIESCGVFLADLSITHPGGTPAVTEDAPSDESPEMDDEVEAPAKVRVLRGAANSNVLVETGYALKAVGLDRILLAFNTHYGDINDLPFDLPRTRLVTYAAAPGDKDRSKERARFVKTLVAALRMILPLIMPAPPPDPLELLLKAIRERDPARKSSIEAYFRGLLDQLRSLPRTDIVSWARDAIGQAAPFFKLAEHIALYGDATDLSGFHAGFKQVLQNHWASPYRHHHGFDELKHDSEWLLGYILFVRLVAILFKHERYPLLDEFLKDCVFLVKLKNGERQDSGFSELSRGGLQKLGNAISPTGKLLGSVDNN